MTGMKNTYVAQPTSPQRPDRNTYKSRAIENPPWIVWRVWSRDIQDELTQHIVDDYVLLSSLYISKMFYKHLNAWGLQFNQKGSSFHILEVKEISRLDIRADAAKVVLDAIPLKCADVSSTDKWTVTAFKDLAEVLYDTLKSGDYLVIWGSRVRLESRAIILNSSRNTQSFPKTFIVAYRHGENQPEQNPHQQFHIPFNSRDVHNSFVKSQGLEESVVQKICPLVFPMPTESIDLSEEEEEEGIINHTQNDVHENIVVNLNGTNNMRKRLSDKSDAKLNSTNSLSKSSVSRVSREVQVDPEDEGMELEDVTFSSNSNSNRNDSKRSKTKHSTSNRSEVAVAPLTRKNILLHTKSQSDLRTSKESNYVVEKFVSENPEVNVTSPPDGRRPSRLRNSNPQAEMNKSLSSQESPKLSQSQEQQPTAVQAPSESQDQLSQDIVIELDSQYFPLENGSPENSRNTNSQPGPSQPSPKSADPGMSQYSTGRLLNDLDNRNGQELLGDDESASCVSDSTVERLPINVSTRELSDLKKIRLFHLKCKIHRVHVDQKENIAFLRVTDSTLPPFCPKQLFPNIISPRKIPDSIPRIILEVDILVRNYDKLANGINVQSDEVLLTYVTVEKDETRTPFFTMDGNRSTIQEVPKKPEENVEGGRGENTTNVHVNSNDDDNVSKASSNSTVPVPLRKRRKIDTSESSSSSSGSLYDPDEERPVSSPSKKNKISKTESPFKKKKPSPTSKNSKKMESPTSNIIKVDHEEVKKIKDAFVKLGRLNMTGLKEGQTVNLNHWTDSSSQSSNKSTSPTKLSKNSHDLDPQPSTSSSSRQRLRTRTTSGPSQEKASPGRDRVARNKSRHLNIIEIEISDSNSETNSDASGNSRKMSNGKGTKRKLRKSE